jgi:hypothetical protein
MINGPIMTNVIILSGGTMIEDYYGGFYKQNRPNILV